MGLRFILLYLLVCYFFFHCKWVEGYIKLSKEEDLELDEQLKRLNKPAVKTIKTKYGDVYDCVNFYEQPSFDHPLLKNHTFHPQMVFASTPERVSAKNDISELNVVFEDGGCPLGTVPIRRITKDALIRMNASKINPLAQDQLPGSRIVAVRTKPALSCKGVGATLSVWNNPVAIHEFTAGLIKLSNGYDRIEVGWMVNRDIYGHDGTHMYIYTMYNDAFTQCYNARCGFVQVNTNTPVDALLSPISEYGKQAYGISFFIHQEPGTLNWVLTKDGVVVGFWPNKLFFNLASAGTQASWEGQVYSGRNAPSPRMGSGRSEETDDTSRDASFSNVQVEVDNHRTSPPGGMTEIFLDKSNKYWISDKQNVGGALGYLIFYGGAGGAIGI